MTTEQTITREQFANQYLFEIAWEVCNQVGGIYTVIRSKIPSVIDKWGRQNYILIGPYFPNQVVAEFEPIYDFDCPVGEAVEKMRDDGFEIHYGHWLVTGKPKVILFNPYSVMDKIALIKFVIWEKHHISINSNEDLLNQVLAFGSLVTEFFQYLFKSKTLDKGCVAHFHEWMSSTPIMEIRRLKLPLKTVFTTHATLLGRYLAMNDAYFYDHLSLYDWQKEAEYFNVQSYIALERAAAHGAHIFTTVSEITGNECAQFLGRKPDVILPNGLNIERYDAKHQFQNLHIISKEKIHEFVMGHFFQSYSFNLDKTLYFFTSGRFEYHNKGFDLTLEALTRLNWKMKEANVDSTVVMFFITRNPYFSINPEVLQSKILLEQVRRDSDQIVNNLRDKLFYNVTSSYHNYELPDLNEMIDEYSTLRLRRTLQSWRTKRLPPIVTHNLHNENKDPLLNFLRYSGLHNYQTDKVKVVYHPDFLSASNPLFRLDYHNFVRGCNLGIFPSYYEPWGYTPLECMASGIPSVTSDLSGFGSFVEKHFPEKEKYGLYMVNRLHKNYDDAANQLANILFDFVLTTRRERIAQRNMAEAASVQFDWHELGVFYDIAYSKAIEAE